jgi:hypothetical protein
MKSESNERKEESEKEISKKRMREKRINYLALPHFLL